MAVLAAAGAALGAPAAAHAASPRVLIVAPTGHAGAAGTLADPLATVAQALRRLHRGGTVELRGGVYDQPMTLSGRHNLTIEPHLREHVELDGTHLTAPAGTSAMVTIVDSTGITVS